MNIFPTKYSEQIEQQDGGVEHQPVLAEVKLGCSTQNRPPKQSQNMIVFQLEERGAFNISETDKLQTTYTLYQPIPSMYGIFTYIWLTFMVNAGTYTIHGSYGQWLQEMYPPTPRILIA